MGAELRGIVTVSSMRGRWRLPAPKQSLRARHNLQPQETLAVAFAARAVQRVLH